MQFQFQIISSNLYGHLLARAKKCEGLNLKIIAKDYITDQEIAESIASSYAILCLYLSSTQSAVFANAMMQETPVIASKCGSLPDVIVDGKTGYFVEDVYDHANNIKILEICILKANYHKKYCLEEFHNNYSIDALKPNLLRVINMDI
jgi:glycosyltransferase involved in cell wall biosynthesis